MITSSLSYPTCQKAHNVMPLFMAHNPSLITCLGPRGARAGIQPFADYVPGPEHADDEIIAEDQPYAEDCHAPHCTLGVLSRASTCTTWSNSGVPDRLAISSPHQHHHYRFHSYSVIDYEAAIDSDERAEGCYYSQSHIPLTNLPSTLPTRPDAPPPMPTSAPTSLPPLLLPSASRKRGQTRGNLPPYRSFGYRSCPDIGREIRRDPERYVGYGIMDSWDEIVETLQGALVIQTPSLVHTERVIESMRLSNLRAPQFMHRCQRSQSYSQHLVVTRSDFNLLKIDAQRGGRDERPHSSDWSTTAAGAVTLSRTVSEGITGCHWGALAARDTNQEWRLTAKLRERVSWGLNCVALRVATYPRFQEVQTTVFQRALKEWSSNVRGISMLMTVLHMNLAYAMTWSILRKKMRSSNVQETERDEKARGAELDTSRRKSPRAGRTPKSNRGKQAGRQAHASKGYVLKVEWLLEDRPKSGNIHRGFREEDIPKTAFTGPVLAIMAISTEVVAVHHPGLTQEEVEEDIAYCVKLQRRVIGALCCAKRKVFRSQDWRHNLTEPSVSVVTICDIRFNPGKQCRCLAALSRKDTGSALRTSRTEDWRFWEEMLVENARNLKGDRMEKLEPPRRAE
ncbi:hypothetical protein Tco_1134193 [Tanacetum coccineum]